MSFLYKSIPYTNHMPPYRNHHVIMRLLLRFIRWNRQEFKNTNSKHTEYNIPIHQGAFRFVYWQKLSRLSTLRQQTYPEDETCIKTREIWIL